MTTGAKRLTKIANNSFALVGYASEFHRMPVVLSHYRLRSLEQDQNSSLFLIWCRCLKSRQ